MSIGATLDQTFRAAQHDSVIRVYHHAGYVIERNFGCKTAQFCAARCEWHYSRLPSSRNAVQQSENERKTLP